MNNYLSLYKFHWFSAKAIYANNASWQLVFKNHLLDFHEAWNVCVYDFSTTQQGVLPIFNI